VKAALAANVTAAQGGRLVHRGLCVVADAQLQNGLTGCGVTTVEVWI